MPGSRHRHTVAAGTTHSTWSVGGDTRRVGPPGGVPAKVTTGNRCIAVSVSTLRAAGRSPASGQRQRQCQYCRQRNEAMFANHANSHVDSRRNHCIERCNILREDEPCANQYMKTLIVCCLCSSRSRGFCDNVAATSRDLTHSCHCLLDDCYNRRRTVPRGAGTSTSSLDPNTRSTDG